MRRGSEGISLGTELKRRRLGWEAMGAGLGRGLGELVGGVLKVILDFEALEGRSNTDALREETMLSRALASRSVSTGGVGGAENKEVSSRSGMAVLDEQTAKSAVNKSPA